MTCNLSHSPSKNTWLLISLPKAATSVLRDSSQACPPSSLALLIPKYFQQTIQSSAAQRKERP